MHESMPQTWAVRASTAVFGFTLAVAFAPRLLLTARPDDPLSPLKLAGYRPGGLVLQFVLAVLLTAGGAMLGVRLARLLAAHRWAAVSYCAATLLAPVAMMHYGNLRHVVLLGLAAAAIVALRRLEPRFARGDVILILTLLSCHIAFLDLDFGGTPVATFLRAAMVVFGFRLIVRDPEAWVLSPLALVAQLGWLPPAASAAVALLVLLGSPFLLAWTKFRVSRRIVYPIVVLLYPLAVLQIPPAIHGVNFFEDSHNIAVASEMLRGEKPYTDIIPTHGLISDGVIDYVAMKLGVRSLRTLLDTRLVLGAISSVAIYCLVLAATGTADIALLGALFTFCLFSGSTLWLRPSIALFALAATVAATRLRSRRWFIAAGALLVPAYLLSIDFGLYSAIVALFAAFRARALRALAIGVSVTLVPALLIFAVFGFALDFVRVNLFEILGSHGVYFLRPLAIPDCLRSPALVHTLPYCIEPLVWVIALFASSAALARSPFRAKRSDGPWLIGVWIVVAAASFVERGNYHFFPVVAPFIVVCLFAMWRHARTVAIVLAVIAVIRAEPFRHVISVVPQLRTAEPAALFDPTTAASIEAAKKFTATLKPGETFVDFSNSALIYYLLDRDCPLRQVEVANYQSDEAQRAVIRRIETNPRIRAALITFAGSEQNVDGIPNANRAPLVAAYLQQHFVPVFDEEGVEFWRRR